MENPFESGHIKNYILLYVSVVVIMVLFFIASTLFNEVEDMEKKIFTTELSTQEEKQVKSTLAKEEKEPMFKLMNKAY